MIEIKNIKKRFNNQLLFDDFTYYFPNRGMIAICGPSGCGKTTLLNMISGLLKPDSGSIFHSTVNITNLNDDQISLYRLKNFGFVFQDFKLFETETVFNNITLPLDCLSHTSKKIKERKIKDLLALVSLKDKENQSINLLSGGEKQRVAIARSLINDPDVIFADEPTGALDEKNAKQVMDILKVVATKSLVIIVSHDENLVREYANKVIHMLDGKIIKEENIKEVGEKQNLPILLKKKKLKKTSVPLSFLIHHSYKKMKDKKWRMMMCDFVMSLSLIGVGAAISLTSSISSNIKKAYGDILGEDRICINKKNDNNKNYGIYSCSSEEAEKIAQKMEEYVFDYGVNYFIDYEGFTTNEHVVSFKKENEERDFIIDTFTLRDFNEYIWLDDINTIDMYPYQINLIEKSEIILGLDIVTIRDICFGLRIERTVTSLSNYLEHNTLYMNLNLENTDWNYNRTVSFKVKGFFLEKECNIYHSYHDFNEYVFERLLSFSPTNYISGFSKYPWDLRKIYYLKMKGKNCDDFLKASFNDIELYGYIFEIANKTYYPKLYKKIEIQDVDRLLIFLDYRNGINLNITPYIERICNHLSSPIFATYGGYSIYPSSFMSGFSRPTYFSSDIEKLDEAVEVIEDINDTNKIDELPKGVLSGYFANVNQNNVSYIPLIDKEVEKLDIHEVVISKGMAKDLFDVEEVINKKIYLTFNIRDTSISPTKIKKEYVNAELTIKGVSDENKYIIHQNPNWAILFFQCRLGVSIFSLSTYAISYMVDAKKNMNDSISVGNKNFSELEFYNPMSDFNLGVDEICHFIEIALLIFSIISIIVSILLLSTCAYLHVIENKKDIGLARCLGLPKRESIKFIFSYSLITGLISFTLSSIELIGFTFFSMYTISNILGSSTIFTFNPLSILLMFSITFFVSMFSSAIFSRKITKMNPLESIK